MINLGNMFDEYALRARVYPGLLACLPIMVTLLLLWPSLNWKALWLLIGGVGGTFLLANYVRSLGKRLEMELIRKWNGLPTTHMLRHREMDNPVMFRRRRLGLERVFGEPLPSPDEEQANEATADAKYVAATKALIAKVRSDKVRYPRVHEENIHYGFRRNLLALKTFSLILLGILITIDILASIISFRSLDLVAIGINLMMSLVWIVVVQEQWVQEAGQTYAERLFETLEQDGLTT
jgi:hypothetical protein